MSSREERLARNEAASREINEKIIPRVLETPTPWSEGLSRPFDRCEVGPAQTGAGSNLPSLRRGSGYEQAKAKLRCIESDEVTVAFGPPA